MTRCPNIDPTPGLRGRMAAFDAVVKQRAWIEYCEANGESYAGPNGPAIREADMNELRRLESKLAHYDGADVEED